MDERKADIISGIVLFGLSIVIYINATGIEQRLPVGLDSGIFPEMASILLAILSVIVVVRAWRAPRREGETSEIDKRGLASVALSFCLIVAYVIAVDALGFVVATIVYLPLQFFALSPSGERRWLAFVVVSVLTTAVVYAAFTYGFRLILPRGTFI